LISVNEYVTCMVIMFVLKEQIYMKMLVSNEKNESWVIAHIIFLLSYLSLIVSSLKRRQL
jgi:hypothetical protein